MKKSIVFFAALVLSTTILLGQNTKFTLNGKIEGMTSGSLYFGHTDNNGQYLKKTIPVENGKFKLEGNISEPTQVLLCLDSTIQLMGRSESSRFLDRSHHHAHGSNCRGI